MNSDDQSTDPESLEAVEARLADPAVWAEPPASLQEQIVTAIATERDGVRRKRSILATLVSSAAALVLVVGIAVGVSLIRDDDTVTFTAALRGTDLAPKASGSATLTKTPSGWKIRLHAEGLPRRADGEYYEAWLKSADGVLVPVGTFNSSDDVTLWSGVPPTSHPTFTVTRQLANGDPASTGEVVLKGTAQREE